MDDDKVILVYPGFWTGPVFKDGEEALLFTSLRTKSYTQFLDEVHKLVQAPRRYFEYVLHCFIPMEDGLKKSFVMSDEDLHRVAKIFKTPKIYVNLKLKHLGMNGPPAHGNHSYNHHDMLEKSENNFFCPVPSSQGTNVNPIPNGGCNFPTENMPQPFPYSHGAEPSSAPWVNGAWLSSGPVVNQPKPNAALVVKKPNVSSKPGVNQPKPNAAQVVKKPNVSSKPVVNQPTLGSGTVVPQARVMKRALEVNQPVKDGEIDIESFGLINKRRALGVNDDRCPTDDEESSC